MSKRLQSGVVWAAIKRTNKCTGEADAIPTYSSLGFDLPIAQLHSPSCDRRMLRLLPVWRTLFFSFGAIHKDAVDKLSDHALRDGGRNTTVQNATHASAVVALLLLCQRRCHLPCHA